MSNSSQYPRSPHDKVGGIVYFGRMIDKIRLNAAGTLHPDLTANLGTAFDKRCCDFIGVDYAELAGVVAMNGFHDEAALAWCFTKGRKPTEEQIEIWNGFMLKRGWRDSGTPTLEKRKAENGFQSRDEIQTMFDYIDADEGRALRKWW